MRRLVSALLVFAATVAVAAGCRNNDPYYRAAGWPKCNCAK
jgi:hypothetical protein